MAGVKVNTEYVEIAAGNIRTINGQIRDGIKDVRTAISQMDASWDGSASSNALDKFYSICNKYPDSRYKVMDQFANYLLQQVGLGYEQTEDVNKSLADEFK